MKNLKLLSLIGLSSILFSCGGKNIIDVKNQQIGLCLSSYFDAYARQPEAAENLNEAKKLLLSAFYNVSNEGSYYGLGCLGGAKDKARYSEPGSGIFDAIARQPEEFNKFKETENNTINYITNAKSETKAEMIGYASSFLCDAIARQPEIYEIEDKIDLKESSELINNYIINKSDNSALAIGYASKGFYDACARQPESMENMWTEFKSYIDTLN